MTNDDLEAIRARAVPHAKCTVCHGESRDTDACRGCLDTGKPHLMDVLTLLAEVDRLRRLEAVADDELSACARVTPAQVAAYLMVQGWRLGMIDPGHERLWAKWQSKGDWLLVPRIPECQTWKDYSRCIERTVTTLSVLEARAPVRILCDLLGTVTP